MAAEVEKVLASNGSVLPDLSAMQRRDQGGGTFAEVGRTGLARYGGYIYEEFLRELWGRRGMRVYREMRDNDPVIGALLFGFEMLSRQADWKIEPATLPADATETMRARAQELADFTSGAMFEDMSTTWQSTLSEILSMLPFGWAWLEIVYKRRVGPEETSASTRSRFTDGRIGWRKWSIRSQESLLRWEFDDESGVQALVQQPAPTFETFTIPIQKSLLFRVSTARGNPEGHSLLRNAYRPWYFKRRMEEVEGIGVERDLAGLPVLIPPQGLDLWNAKNADAVTYKAAAEKMVRSIRRDEQEGVLLPHGWELKLLTTGGRRNFDTSEIVRRYDMRILITVLADFILLGQERVGSYALSRTKTQYFSLALSAVLDELVAVVNRHAIPRLLTLNGYGGEDLTTLVPVLAHAEVEEPDLVELGNYVLQLSQAGASLLPDDRVEAYLRQVGRLPLQEGIDDTIAKGVVLDARGRPARRALPARRAADPRDRDAFLKAAEDMTSYIKRMRWDR